jgi:glucose/arabinose dehydrogenase
MIHLGFPLAVIALAALGCTDDGGQQPPPPPPPVSGGLGLATVGNFAFPVFVTSPPGDNARLFVVEKRGTIRIVKQGSTLSAPFLDLSGAVSTGGEQGLLGLAFHPQYASNRLFVVNYTDTEGDTQVSLFRASATDPDRADAASEQVILAVAQPFTNHNGGMVAFGPQDGHLYIGMGDGGSANDPQGNGQRLSTLLGKLVRLAISSSGQVSIPADNPFVGQTGARAEIWSLGLRNPWRFSFDRTTGDLYLGDVGQNEREEIDMVSRAASRGANFGWSVMEGTACFRAGSCDRQGLILPVVEYLHADGCSVTGGYAYRGTAIPTLAGTYFYADYCAGWVRSFRLSNGSVVEPREWTGLEPNGSITSFGEDAQGELYLMTSSGRVAKIVAQP